MPKKSKQSILFLDEIKPNWAIQQFYIKVLYKLTGKMVNNVELSLETKYKQTDDSATNAVRLAQVNKHFNHKIDEWQQEFNQQSKPIASKVVTDVDNDVQRQLKRTIDKNITNSEFKINFSNTNKDILAKSQGAFKENVHLIRNIPEKMREQIQFTLNQAISQGRDFNFVKKKLHKIGRFTEKRAKTIARDQLFKATSTFSTMRQKELGITQQQWVYTNISKEPRLSHKHANGEIYDIDKGCWIDNEFIYPGQKINCKCSSRPVIKFSD